MRLDWIKIKEIAEMPAGKALITILLWGLVSATAIYGGVILYQNSRARDYEKQIRLCDEARRVEVLKIQRETAETVNAVRERAKLEAVSFLQGRVDQLEEKELQLDEALTESRGAIYSSEKQKAKIQKITDKVSKIVKNATR